MTTSFTDKLRSEAGEQWDRVINHKFTTELASGKINREGMTYVKAELSLRFGVVVLRL